ncbi:MAG: DNA primase [Actinobacteria bacterium RBG_19FT_COMBO_70_19]|nr:MAG: DNA primase [Actinobacteria bacterium RBG_19FT_COMBO_70_19]
MAGKIRQDDLDAVRERTDIVKLVSGYLTLKKSGHDSFSGLCPFHTEKTPSFSVSPSKGVFYCFGCGAGGDAIKFLREVEHLDFAEAVERLAKEAGVTLRYEGDTPAERRAASRRQALHRANEEAFDLYHRMLLEGHEGEEARAYLASRGIDRETWVGFGIGYAPGYPDFLLRRLSKSLSSEILVEAGLAIRDNEGNVRDRFRGRITFPVHDLSGRAVGIGARVLPGARDDGPKYLNSPETPIYRKGEVLYNLNRAKGAVAKSGEVFLVEGYTDVIAMARAGLESAVATCGTALGEGHFRLASRFAQRMVLAFDSDEAGARAAERAYAFLEAFPVQPVVLILPEGLDPADFVRAHGGEALRELAATARPLVEYMIRRTVGRHDLSTVEGQTAAVAAALPVLEGLGDPVRQSEYAHLLAELADVTEGSVVLALERRMSGKPIELEKEVKRASAQEKVEREMLRLLARDWDIFRELAPRLVDEHFQTAGSRKLFATLVGAHGDVGSFVAASRDDKLVRALSALALEPLDGEPTAEYAQDVWARLQEFMLKRRSAELRQRLQKLNPTTDAGYDDLFQELIAADGELRRLRERGGVPA